MYHDTFPVEQKLRHVPADAIVWAGANVVDLGCNSGALGPYVLKRGAATYVGYEVDADWATEGRRRHPELTIITGRAEEADLSTATVVCALGLFHHMRSEAVAQVLRAASAAHTVVCEQPMGAPFQGYHMRPETWYRTALADAGFPTIMRVAYGFQYRVDRAILIATR